MVLCSVGQGLYTRTLKILTEFKVQTSMKFIFVVVSFLCISRFITHNSLSLSHASTERAEHIQIIITSAQNADNVIPTFGLFVKYHMGQSN